MKTCTVLSLAILLLMLPSCSRMALPGDSPQYLQALWEKRMTQCGENHWTELVGGGVGEYKSFNRAAHEIPVTDIDRNLNHVEWRVRTFVRQGTPLPRLEFLLETMGSR